MTDPAELSQINFAKNMEFFRKEHPRIYKSVQNVQKHPGRRKQLLYEPSAGGFCIVDENSALLFDYDPNESLQLDKKLHVRSRYRFKESERSSYVNKNYFKLCEMSFTEAPDDSNPPKKAIFAGVGAIHKTNLFLEKADIDVALIYEPDIEILFLATYAIPFYRYAESKKIFFLVSADDDETIEKFSHFKPEYNPLLCKIPANVKYDHALHGDKIIVKMSKFMHSAIHNDMSKLKNIASHLKNGYPYISAYRQLEEAPPLLLLSSGPSLDKSMEWVEKNMDRFVIAAVGSAAMRLCERGIRVDFLFSADPKKRIAKQFSALPSAFRDDLFFIAAEQTDPDVLSLFKRPVISDTPVRATVNHFAIENLVDLGFDKIYTLGNDAALAESLDEYSSGIVSDKEEVSTNEVIHIKGNIRPYVPTTQKLIGYLPEYTKIADIYPDVKFFNLSDGAFIEGFTPMQHEDIDPDSFPSIPKNRREAIMDLFSKSLYKDYYYPNISKRLAILKKVTKELKKWKDAPLEPSKSYCDYQQKRFKKLQRILEPAKSIQTYDWLMKLLYAIDVPTSVLLSPSRFTSRLKDLDRMNREIFFTMTKDYLSYLEGIANHASKQPFYEKYMQLHTDVFDERLFGVRHLKHRLTPLERRFLYRIKKEVNSRPIDKKIRSRIALYISLLEGDFKNGIEEFLKSASTPKERTMRAEWLRKLPMRIKGFTLSEEEHRLISMLIKGE